MRAPGLAVERSQAEAVRRKLASGGWLEGELRPRREGARVVFPISLEHGAPPSDLPGTRGEFDFEPAPTVRGRDYREALHLPRQLQELLPSAFDVIGDIVLVRLPPALLDHAPEVGKALLDFVPGCRLVGLDRGVHGTARLRALERLAGTGDWATRHRENGITLNVDVEKAYFSPRLAREHALVADAVRPGERLLDLFCGVGPFALTALARCPTCRAVAVDLNPEAIRLLRESARRLRVSSRLEALEVPAEEFFRRPETFPRVVMNLPREGYKYATQVARLVMVEGTLHTYEVVERDQVEARTEALRHDLEAGSQGPWTVAPPHVVHPYSPSSDLLSWTAQRRG